MARLLKKNMTKAQLKAVHAAEHEIVKQAWADICFVEETLNQKPISVDGFQFPAMA
jgi:hypothetical protein